MGQEESQSQSEGEKIPFGKTLAQQAEDDKRDFLMNFTDDDKIKVSEDKNLTQIVPQCPPECPTKDDVDEAKYLWETAKTTLENRDKQFYGWMFKKESQEDLKLKQQAFIGMTKLHQRCKNCYIPLPACPKPCPNLDEVLDAEGERMVLLSDISGMPYETEEQKSQIDSLFIKYKEMDQWAMKKRDDYNLCKEGCDPGDDPSGPRVTHQIR